MSAVSFYSILPPYRLGRLHSKLGSFASKLVQTKVFPDKPTNVTVDEVIGLKKEIASLLDELRQDSVKPAIRARLVCLFQYGYLQTSDFELGSGNVDPMLTWEDSQRFEIILRLLQGIQMDTSKLRPQKVGPLTILVDDGNALVNEQLDFVIPRVSSSFPVPSPEPFLRSRSGDPIPWYTNQIVLKTLPSSLTVVPSTVEATPPLTPESTVPTKVSTKVQTPRCASYPVPSKCHIVASSGAYISLYYFSFSLSDTKVLGVVSSGTEDMFSYQKAGRNNVPYPVVPPSTSVKTTPSPFPASSFIYHAYLPVEALYKYKLDDSFWKTYTQAVISFIQKADQEGQESITIPPLGQHNHKIKNLLKEIISLPLKSLCEIRFVTQNKDIYQRFKGNMYSVDKSSSFGCQPKKSLPKPVTLTATEAEQEGKFATTVLES